MTLRGAGVAVSARHNALGSIHMLIGGTAQMFVAQALPLGEAAVVGPLRYSSIVWVVALDYVFWGELPDVMVVSGLVIVICSGLYILHRETRLAIIERRLDLPDR